MTTKNFLLFQAGKNFGLGRTIPEELFKPENFGKVLTLQGADDTPYLGTEDLPKLFIAEFGYTSFLDVKNAYDTGAVVMCYYNGALYQLYSFTGFKIEFAQTLKDADGKIFYATTAVTVDGWVSNDIELAKKSDIEVMEADWDDTPFDDVVQALDSGKVVTVKYYGIIHRASVLYRGSYVIFESIYNSTNGILQYSQVKCTPAGWFPPTGTEIATHADTNTLNQRIEAIENFLNGKKFLLADDQ